MKAELFFPEFYLFQPIWLKLLDEDKVYFNENVMLKGIFGSFPNMDWNGGRVCLSEKTPSMEEIENTFKAYKDRNISLTLCLTNLCLEDKHLKDEYCNEICRIANEYEASCNVVDKKLSEYLYTNYPNIQQNRSVICNYSKMSEIKSNGYIVINSKYNYDFEYLSKLTNPDKAVLLVNEGCFSCCPRIFHYKQISLSQLRHKSQDYICENIANKKAWLYYKDIEKYLVLGINKFKFNDREIEDIEETLNCSLSWLIKPEYFTKIYNKYKKYSLSLGFNYFTN